MCDVTDVPSDAQLDYPRPHRQPVDSRVHPISPKTQAVGMWLFLLSLALLFASSLLIYVIIRMQMRGEAPIGAFREAMSDWKLYSSTVVVLAASFAIHRALRAVQRERIGKFRTWLWITNILATLFVVVQTPAMIDLLSQDTATADTSQLRPVISPLDPDAGATVGPRDILPQARETRLYGILFFFVLIHALHVLGGMVYLAVVTIKAHKGWYDHEHFVGVRHAALYWHFLDVVWLMMFGTFLAMG